MISRFFSSIQVLTHFTQFPFPVIAWTSHSKHCQIVTGITMICQFHDLKKCLWFHEFSSSNFQLFISFWHNFRFRWLHALHIWKKFCRQKYDPSNSRFFFLLIFVQSVSADWNTLHIQKLVKLVQAQVWSVNFTIFLARFLTFSPTVRRGGGSGARGLHSQTLATCWIAVLGWGHCWCCCRGCCRGCCSWGQCCCLVWRPSI